MFEHMEKHRMLSCGNGNLALYKTRMQGFKPIQLPQFFGYSVNSILIESKEHMEPVIWIT